MVVILTSDHAGFELKEYLKTSLAPKYEVKDLGCSGCEAVNYALQGIDLAKEVLLYTETGQEVFGVAVCGTGIGISIALNRFSDIRAARVCSLEDAFLARSHNNANVIALGGRQLSKEAALDFVETFLSTPFSGQRHKERVDTLKKVGEKLGEN